MIDSGANISIAKRELAERMGVMIRTAKEKIRIQFGKEGARSEAIGYANFGDLIGDVAIVEDASDTLIHIKTFTDKGMRVVFEGDKVKIIDEDGEMVIQGQCDESQLYYIDIEEAMRISIEYGQKKRKRKQARQTERTVMGLSAPRAIIKSGEEKEKESIWGIEEEETKESEGEEEVNEGEASDKNYQEQGDSVDVTNRSEQQVEEKEKSRTRKRKSIRGERVEYR